VVHRWQRPGGNRALTIVRQLLFWDRGNLTRALPNRARRVGQQLEERRGRLSGFIRRRSRGSRNPAAGLAREPEASDATNELSRL